MLHIIKNALGDGLVLLSPRDASKGQVFTGSETIFGAPLSEAADAVRADALQGAQRGFVTVTVTPEPADGIQAVGRIG